MGILCKRSRRPTLTKVGWLLKDAGFNSTAIKGIMQVKLKGTGTLVTSEYSADTLSKYPDITTWGVFGAVGRYIYNTLEYFDKDGVSLTGCQVITNRIFDASYCDIASLDWGNADCAGGTVNDVSKVEMTMDYPQPTGGASVPPAIVYSFSADFSDYEVEVPTLYRIPDITSGSPTYTDITPTSGGEKYVPMNPYALSADSVNAGKINAILRGGGGQSYLGTSTDSGSTWSLSDNIGYYYGVKAIDVFGLLWGYDTILYTEDDFGTSTELYSGWIGSIDSGGYVKTVKAAF